MTGLHQGIYDIFFVKYSGHDTDGTLKMHGELEAMLEFTINAKGLLLSDIKRDGLWRFM